MQRHRVAGDPGQRGAEAGAAVLAPVGVQMGIQRAQAAEMAQRQRALGRLALRLDRDQAGGAVGIDLLGLQHRAALRRDRQQRAAFLALHHVVRPEGLADVPGDDAPAGGELPVGEVEVGVELVDAARCGDLRVAVGALQRGLGVQMQAQAGLSVERTAGVGAQLDLRAAAVARRGDAPVPARPRLGPGAGGGRLLELARQPQLAREREAGRGGGRRRLVGAGHRGHRHGHGHRQQGRDRCHRAHSSVGLRTSAIGFSQDSGTRRT